MFDVPQTLSVIVTMLLCPDCPILGSPSNWPPCPLGKAPVASDSLPAVWHKTPSARFVWVSSSDLETGIFSSNSFFPIQELKMILLANYTDSRLDFPTSQQRPVIFVFFFFFQKFPGGPVVKTQHCWGLCSVPGQGTNENHATQPKRKKRRKKFSFTRLLISSDCFQHNVIIHSGYKYSDVRHFEEWRCWY